MAGVVFQKKIPYTIFINNPDGTLLSEGEPSGLSV